MTPPAQQPTRRPGRPRKWTDDADRARAYRQRRAAELAEPDQLRADRRALRREVAELRRRATGVERALARARREREEALEELARQSLDLAAARAKLERLSQLHNAAPQRRDPHPVELAAPGRKISGNRSQRRRWARGRGG